LTTISLRNNWPLLLLFVAIVMGIGFVVGLISAPGPWYEALAKPPYILPDSVNGAVWFLLCVAFAVSGWRLWLIDATSIETRLWLASLIVSWWFSPIFFVARAPYAALAVIICLTALMLIFIVRTWRVDRLSAALFVPCAAWVGYAMVLTAMIAQMNPVLPA
jgi:tryptophan-rich sensory protein